MGKSHSFAHAHLTQLTIFNYFLFQGLFSALQRKVGPSLSGGRSLVFLRPMATVNKIPGELVYYNLGC